MDLQMLMLKPVRICPISRSEYTHGREICQSRGETFSVFSPFSRIVPGVAAAVPRNAAAFAEVKLALNLEVQRQLSNR